MRLQQLCLHLVSKMMVQEGEMARISGIWGGYFKGLQQQYQAFNQYIVTARIIDDNWQRVYTSTYKNRTINNLAETLEHR